MPGRSLRKSLLQEPTAQCTRPGRKRPGAAGAAPVQALGFGWFRVHLIMICIHPKTSNSTSAGCSLRAGPLHIHQTFLKDHAGLTHLGSKIWCNVGYPLAHTVVICYYVWPRVGVQSGIVVSHTGHESKIPKPGDGEADSKWSQQSCKLLKGSRG